ncbi:alpha/beta fold hydrolase [Methanolobus sp. WCC4]|uniref:alpha/beta hydrolase n=1 Tax=Methanolobus sp. WCC4 TaxID=3125784 RepID=UPI0030F74527
MSKHHINKGKRKAPEQKINVKLLPLAIGILLMAAGVIGVSLSSDEEEWSVSDDGILSYSHIDETEYSVSRLEINDDNTTVKTSTFKSRDSDIEALIRLPDQDTTVPGVVVLPGAGVSKEQQTAIPELLAEIGYASITIDQRNLGGIDPQGDLELFMSGEEPVEYMMVHDAMVAADVLGEQSGVDSQNIAMLGLSNGGRFAIIATAIDPDIKGVVAISTSGYDMDNIVVDESIDLEAYRFYRSIDPDNYLADIAPRRIVMFHSVNDSIIPFETAQKTFDKANEPKAFYHVNGSTHGYSALMADDLQNELAIIFQ